jgi:hypothetical protein
MLGKERLDGVHVDAGSELLLDRRCPPGHPQLEVGVPAERPARVD